MLFISGITIKQITHVTPTNALFHHLCIQYLTWLLQVSAQLSRHLQGADIKIYLKHAAVK
jgi:hypothetical protein